MDLLPKIPTASVDLVLCDPPFGVTANKWDSPLDLQRMWAELRRVCRGTVVLFAVSPFDKILANSNLRAFKYEWIWETGRPTGFLNSKRRPLRVHQNVLVFQEPGSSPKDTPYFPQMMQGTPYRRPGNGVTSNYGSYGPHRGVIGETVTSRYPTSIIRFTNNERGQHPTQKPVPLLEYLIRTYVRPGSTVLDHCMGSGSTGVAALRQGCHFVGMELHASYFQIAKRRMSKEQP